MALLDLANPTRFLALVARALPWLAAASVGVLAVAGYLAFFASPEDYQQGEHGPDHVYPRASGLAVDVLLRGDGRARRLGTLVWRHPLADVLGARPPRRSAPPSRFICLLTGSLWGRPMWGTYWVWDARLTSDAGAVLPVSRPAWRFEPRRTTIPAAARRAAAILALDRRRSTCRSSSSRSTGGTRCTSPPLSSASAGRRSIRPS